MKTIDDIREEMINTEAVKLGPHKMGSILIKIAKMDLEEFLQHGLDLGLITEDEAKEFNSKGKL